MLGSIFTMARSKENSKSNQGNLKIPIWTWKGRKERELREPHSPQNSPSTPKVLRKSLPRQPTWHFDSYPKVYHTVTQHKSLTDCFCWKSISHLTYRISIWHWHSKISNPGLVRAPPLCCLAHATFKLAKYFAISVLNSLEPSLPTTPNNMSV